MPSGSQSSQSQTQYSQTSPAKSSQTKIQHQGGRNENGQVVCKHDLPAKDFVIKAEGNPNKGKQFYRCPLQGDSDCKYWCLAEKMQPLRSGSPSKSQQPTPSSSKIIPPAGFQPSPSKSTQPKFQPKEAPATPRSQKTPPPHDQYDAYLDEAISSSPSSPTKRGKEPDVFDEIEDSEPEVKRQKFTDFAVTPSSSPMKSPGTAKGSPSKDDGVLSTISELGKVLGGRVEEVIEDLRKELNKSARKSLAAEKSKEYKDKLIQELKNEVDLLRGKNTSLEAELEGYRNA